TIPTTCSGRRRDSRVEPETLAIPQVPPSSSQPIGPAFSKGDFDRALLVLDVCLQNFIWKPGENYLTADCLFAAMSAKDITYALSMQLFRDLIERKVFRLWSQTIPAGTRWEGGMPVHRTEPETTHCLVVTREAWYRFLAEYWQSGTADVGEVTRAESPTSPI